MGTRDRVNSATMTQHVGLKGHNGCDIFLDEEDREVFLEKIEQACDTSGVQVSAWALMSNHVHLLMHGDVKDFPSFFQSLGRTFATHNANKYEHTGALWNGRYYAKPIQTAEQFCQTAAYIFNNPVAAGQVKNPEDSGWTNFATVMNGEDKLACELLDEIGNVEHIIEFTETYSKIKLTAEQVKQLEAIPKGRLLDCQAIKVIKQVAKTTGVANILKLGEKKKKKLVKKLFKKGSTYHQIRRLTGLTRPMVDKLLC